MKRNKFRAILNYIYEIQKIIYETKKCKQEHCTPNCKAYAICEDLRKARSYIWNKIQEREALELR